MEIRHEDLSDEEVVKAARSSGWIDVTVPLESGMLSWPSDPAVAVERARSMSAGASCNVSRLELGAHTGTHVDAPLHFVDGGQGIDTMPVSATVGPARVIEIEDPHRVTVDELRPHAVRRGERILFRTRNSRERWHERPFDERFVHVSLEAAEHLAQVCVRTVGIDYLSVGGYKGDNHAIHRALLGAGIWIIEGLDLSEVSSGSYTLMCLPLRILGGDGAPARALLRRDGGEAR